MVRGIKGPAGQLPRIRSVNMTGRSRNGEVSQGGLLIKDLHISMYAGAERFGDVQSGDCIGMPNSSQFAIFNNIEVNGCQHHAFITSAASSLYLEITGSKFRYAKSHLAYIDSVAMAYIRDSSFESPGWGHALRCIAGKCIIKNVKVSNINLDGSIASPKGKQIVGMHPLEVYNCGGAHLVKNVRIDFYRSREYLAGDHASHFRTRDAKWGCDLAYHDGKEWFSFDYGSPEWRANKNWPERKLKYQDVEVNCLSPDAADQNVGCYGIGTWGSHPVARDDYRNSLQRWLRQQKFDTWEQMISALPDAQLPYPTSWYQWTASRLLPGQRKFWLTGKFLNKWPVQPHPSAPANLAVLELENVTINNGLGRFVAPRSKSTRFCWTEFDVKNTCIDKSMPAARFTRVQ